MLDSHLVQFSFFIISCNRLDWLQKTKLSWKRPFVVVKRSVIICNFEADINQNWKCTFRVVPKMTNQTIKGKKMCRIRSFELSRKSSAYSNRVTDNSPMLTFHSIAFMVPLFICIHNGEHHLWSVCSVSRSFYRDRITSCLRSCIDCALERLSYASFK